MYKLVGHSKASAGIQQFVADTKADLANIKFCEMGSTVYVIDEQTTYIKDGKGEWEKKADAGTGSGGGGGGSIPEGYVKPQGTLVINQNGTHDVRYYEKVEVSGIANEIDNFSFDAFIEGNLTVLNSHASIVRAPYDYNAMPTHAAVFQNNSTLETINLPNAALIDGEGVFSGCDKLREVSIPKVESIGPSTFEDCISLQTVEMPSIKRIGTAAFRNCAELNKVDITNVTFGIVDDENNIIDEGTDVFSGCADLVEVKMDNVTVIPADTFYGCEKLVVTELPQNLVEIGSAAFANCSAIAISSIPASVRLIADNAFASCNGITAIEFEGTPEEIGLDAFRWCDNLVTITVPWAEGAVDNAPWGADYATIIYKG